MKKIVALVLSLVMVLGLATTAFAATTSTGSVATTSVTPVKAVWYGLADENHDSMWADPLVITKIELTTVSGKVDNDVPKYVPNLYEINDNGQIFMEVAKADAKYALYNNGEYIFLAKAGNAATGAALVAADNSPAVTADVVDSIVLPVADDSVDCGDAYITTAAGKVAYPYYMIDGTAYVVGGNKLAYFNGEFVFYGNKIDFEDHNWDATSIIVRDTDVKGVKVPVTIECSECEKTFAVVGAAKFDNTWVKFVNYDVVEQGEAGYDTMKGYYIVLDEVTAVTPSAPEATDKVESAETFDAGIAMYVGMSVMAAAGSAVVLKKKD